MTTPEWLEGGYVRISPKSESRVNKTRCSVWHASITLLSLAPRRLSSITVSASCPCSAKIVRAEPGRFSSSLHSTVEPDQAETLMTRSLVTSAA